MNKQDLVAAVGEATGMARGDAGRAVDAVFDAITVALKGGDDVKLVGFGTFEVTHRKGSQGVNPRTREPMTIAPANAPKFRAGKLLKDAVN